MSTADALRIFGDPARTGAIIAKDDFGLLTMYDGYTDLFTTKEKGQGALVALRKPTRQEDDNHGETL